MEDKGKMRGYRWKSTIPNNILDCADIRVPKVRVRCTWVERIILVDFHRGANINRRLNTFCAGLRIYLPEHLDAIVGRRKSSVQLFAFGFQNLIPSYRRLT